MTAPQKRDVGQLIADLRVAQDFVSLTRIDGSNAHRHSTFHCSLGEARQLADALSAAAEWSATDTAADPTQEGDR